MRRGDKRLILWLVGVVVAMPLLIVLLVVGWIFVFFSSGAMYSGDGEYRHPGTHGATFQVTFPAVDLSTRSTRRYTFTRLAPTIGWVVGVRSSGECDAIVELTLSNESGAIVFRRRLEVNGADLVTVDGQLKEVPIDNHGSVRIDAIGTGPDEGWGTHFRPRWRGRYVLQAAVIRTARQSRCHAHVAMEAYMP